VYPGTAQICWIISGTGEAIDFQFGREKPIISPGWTDNRLLYQSGPD